MLWKSKTSTEGHRINYTGVEITFSETEEYFEICCSIYCSDLCGCEQKLIVDHGCFSEDGSFWFGAGGCA